MKVLTALVVVFLVSHGFAAPATPTVCEEKLKTLTQKVDIVLRQLQLQQMFIEERARTDGGSGIKQARWSSIGTRPYHTSTHTLTWSAGAAYPRPPQRNLFSLFGMSAVLNGVEFPIRTLSDQLKMPSRTSKAFHAKELVPLGVVPPQVLAKKTVPEQIAEMKEWFKAWRDQNYKVRDYRKYFKPVLCYLEGKWLKSQGTDKLPYSQMLIAQQWTSRYQAYSGALPQERVTFKPTSIIDFENGKPAFAKWDYRVLCHPVNQDIHTSTFRVVDDLAERTPRRWDLNRFARSTLAKFQLNPMNRPWAKNEEFSSNYEFLDQLMAQIPGVDNYPGRLYDDSFAEPVHPFTAATSKEPKLNTAYYNRWSKVSQTSTGRMKARHRGFSDNSVFMAQTSHPQVAGMKVEDCNVVGVNKVCKSYEQRWSYAIPLFITYITPLSSWNPYGLTIHTKLGYNDRTVFTGGRNGGFTTAKAYNGTSYNFYYTIPTEFFGSPQRGAAAPKGVLDPNGGLRKVSTGGLHSILPNIPGVGALRQTYPIFPIHGEGSTAWKEYEALADLVLKRKTHANMFLEPLQNI
ncbi:uncharacterized protein LOC106152737 [Lingula anatina]|uniref:Uncharacterized protein LOC106152737 n=1 Tax=Lingula anatina TaxID=7574 RepID=A0A1S3H8U6_LINAN|nr:uncharacterized protein LOC106152737 [Lingula anatina]|eukprot:XP_013381901.1 uncharacterized protein LOC106152737 [Lingula anatina]